VTDALWLSISTFVGLSKNNLIKLYLWKIIFWKIYFKIWSNFKKIMFIKAFTTLRCSILNLLQQLEFRLVNMTISNPKFIILFGTPAKNNGVKLKTRARNFTWKDVFLNMWAWVFFRIVTGKLIYILPCEMTDKKIVRALATELGLPFLFFFTCWVRVASSTWNVWRFWNTNKGRLQLLQKTNQESDLEACRRSH